jgi:hypothetical protein
LTFDCAVDRIKDVHLNIEAMSGSSTTEDSSERMRLVQAFELQVGSRPGADKVKHSSPVRLTRYVKRCSSD